MKDSSDAVGKDLACPKKFIYVAQGDDNDNPRKANRYQKYNKDAPLLNKEHARGVEVGQELDCMFRERNTVQH